MVTPETKGVDLVNKAIGWNPIPCSHEELINLVKKNFIEGQSEEYLKHVEKVSKGGFQNEFFLITPNNRYELYIESAAYSKGRLVTIWDREERIIYARDYLFLQKFAEAVMEECAKKLGNPMSECDKQNGINFGNRESDMGMLILYCPQCGAKCGMSDIFCGECGNLLKEKGKSEEEE